METLVNEGSHEAMLNYQLYFCGFLKSIHVNYKGSIVNVDKDGVSYTVITCDLVWSKWKAMLDNEWLSRDWADSS